MSSIKVAALLIISYSDYAFTFFSYRKERIETTANSSTGSQWTCHGGTLHVKREAGPCCQVMQQYTVNCRPNFFKFNNTDMVIG